MARHTIRRELGDRRQTPDIAFTVTDLVIAALATEAGALV